MGLKGGISINADSGPLGYVLVFTFQSVFQDYDTEGGTNLDSKSTSMVSDPVSESPQVSEGAVSPSFLSISESQEERLNTPKPLKLEPNQMEIIDLEQTDDITEEV